MLAGLIHRADLDGLVRLVDDCCASRDWARLRRLRDDARHAVGTGRQLWPAATLAEYRLALLAPAAWAAGVLDEGSGRFTIGPLTEVVAQHHTWAELAPLLEPGPRAAFVAHERALRGEAIDAGADGRAPRRPRPAVRDRRVGARLPRWPPTPTTAASSRAPDLPARSPTSTLPADARRRRSTTTPSSSPCASSSSRGRRRRTAGPTSSPSRATRPGAAARARRGRAPAGRRSTAAEAVAWLAWAGASGGAHGRRRGAAAGRFGALWLVAALADAARRLAAAARRARRGGRRAALVVVGRPRAGDRLAAAAGRRGPRRGRGLGDQRPRRVVTSPARSLIATRMPVAGRVDHLTSAPMSRVRAALALVGVHRRGSRSAACSAAAPAAATTPPTTATVDGGAGGGATEHRPGRGRRPPPSTGDGPAAGRQPRRRRRRQRRQAEARDVDRRADRRDDRAGGHRPRRRRLRLRPAAQRAAEAPRPRQRPRTSTAPTTTTPRAGRSPRRGGPIARTAPRMRTSRGGRDGRRSAGLQGLDQLRAAPCGRRRRCRGRRRRRSAPPCPC